MAFVLNVQITYYECILHMFCLIFRQKTKGFYCFDLKIDFYIFKEKFK